MAVFNFCGKIALGKETDKFKPIERNTYDPSRWMKTSVKFNCVSDTNRVMCTAQAGKNEDDSKNSVRTFTKSVKDENGNVTKGTLIEIPWNKRFDADQVEKVAGFRKFVVDTGDTRMRYKLQNLVEAFENGTDTSKLIEETGVATLADAKAALEKSKAKKKEFLSQWDFVEHLIKVCQSDKFKDKKFYISGTYDVQYNPVNDKFYTSYSPNRVILASDDAELSTKMEMDFFFGEGAFDDSVYEETGKCFINGWISYYDSNKEIKKTGFKPVTITVREDDEKKLKVLKRKFDIEEGIKQLGLTLAVIEGAERKSITMDDLDEETREEIECGLLDFDEVVKALGGNVFGDRISELRFVEFMANKRKVEDTTYELSDMCPARKEVVDVEKIISDVFDEDLPFDIDDDL